MKKSNFKTLQDTTFKRLESDSVKSVIFHEQTILLNFNDGAQVKVSANAYDYNLIYEITKLPEEANK